MLTSLHTNEEMGKPWCTNKQALDPASKGHSTNPKIARMQALKKQDASPLWLTLRTSKKAGHCKQRRTTSGQQHH